MEPEDCLQDLIRCHLCETSLPSMHCDICHVHLCDVCEEKHLSDESKEHYTVPFKMRGLTPKCEKHSTKICKLQCEYCGVPICAECASSEHEQHKKDTFIKSYSLKEELILRDLQELEYIIYPSYQEVASNIPLQRDDLSKHTQKLKVSLDTKAQTLHREIDTIIQKMQADIDEMNLNHLAAINKQETDINQTLKEMSQVILKLKNSLATSDVYFVSKYKSTNHQFKTLPTQLQVTLPSFSPTKNVRERISGQIGSLSKLAIYWRPISTAFLDEPLILANINTRNESTSDSISCLSDSEFWITFQFHNMELYNLHGEIIKSIKPKPISWLKRRIAAVTRNGDLVYTGFWSKSINLVHGTKVQTMFRLRGCRAINICTTSSDDLLVLVYTRKIAKRETKVLRYSSSTVKQSIQWDNQGNSLYKCTVGGYLTENRNLDICVVDCDAKGVVVVNADGQFRFKYIGNPYSTPRSFDPAGITTDSKANILIADCDNHRIHIIDQDGYFLRYIDNCGLHQPIYLSIDTSDNIFIAKQYKCKVTKIQYYK